MAVRTEIVSIHTCDLCEHDCDETDLTRLYGAQRAGKRPQIDICLECQQRPISELVAWIRRREQQAAPRSVRSIRNVTR